MSTVKLTADSGGGTVALAGPSTTTGNAAVTLTLPQNDGDANQVLSTSGSNALSFQTQGYGAFDVQHGSSAQSFPVSTWTKIELKSEIADLDNLFDSSTNYRYTPQVAGWYYVTAHFILTGMNGESHEMYTAIYKNGSSAIKAHGGGREGYGGFAQADVYGFVQMNGSSDYLEAWGWQNNTSSSARDVSTSYTRMVGFLVRRT